MKKPLPENPMLRELVQLSRKHQMSRRAALAGLGGSAAAVTLAACAPAANQLEPATDLSDSEKFLIWHNWDLYIDEDDNGNYPTLQRFESQTGIKVEYKIEIDDNDSYYGKVKDQLALGQDIGADVACPTEWMAARWVNLGYTQKMDAANIPNKKNLAPAYLGASFDPNRDYTLPYQGILAGIAYNKELYKQATGKDAPMTVEDLWDPALMGRVGVLSEMRDTVGVVLLSQGIDISSESSLTEDAFNTAVDFIKAKDDEGKIYNIKGNSYADDFRNDQIIAAIAWSGDMVQLNLEAEYDKYGFVLPESGATISADSFLIPIGATHKKNAEALINYYYDPVNAAELAAWVNYITPVVGAYDEALKIDPALANNELIFPTEDTLSRTHAFRALSGAEEQRFSAAWQRVILGA
ncbi:MAG: PotD/PotF family extracellular solute-binding protein [Actinomycetota bacterium]